MAAFNTPGGGVSAAGRRSARAHGQTMPGTDKFPIRNKSDLEKAKHDVGRTNQPAAARRWINRRAKELGEAPLGGSKESGERRGVKVGDESGAEMKTARRAMMYDHMRSRAQMKD